MDKAAACLCGRPAPEREPTVGTSPKYAEIMKDINELQLRRQALLGELGSLAAEEKQLRARLERLDY